MMKLYYFCLTMFLVIKFFILVSMIVIVKLSPLYMSLLLILYVFMVALYMSLGYISFFYSYLLFMIMVGGLLIVFLYFSSLSNNDAILFSWEIFLKNMMVLLLFVMFLFYKYSNLIYNIYYNVVNLKYDFLYNLYNDNYIYVNELYGYLNYKFIIFSMMFLILLLICVVKMCSYYNFPFRKMKK